MISNRISKPKKEDKYKTNYIVSTIGIIVVALISMGNNILLEKKEIANYRNSDLCQVEVKKEFEAYVFEVSETYQEVSFFKIEDNNRIFFDYHFKTPQEALKNSFEGQKVMKKANDTEIAMIHRSGEKEMIPIPCYQ